MEKSSDAFRTISEVSDDLDLPQHVLRFWETRFPQVRPLKRAGGRRYYRPGDVLLLEAIRKLLYDEGYTIKGVQRLLKDRGTRGVRAGPEPTAFGVEILEAAAPAEAQDVAALASEGEEPTDGEKPAANCNGAMLSGPDHDHGNAVPLNIETLREALVVIEDCERILRALTG